MKAGRVRLPAPAFAGMAATVTAGGEGVERIVRLRECDSRRSRVIQPPEDVRESDGTCDRDPADNPMRLTGAAGVAP